MSLTYPSPFETIEYPLYNFFRVFTLLPATQILIAATVAETPHIDTAAPAAVVATIPSAAKAGGPPAATTGTFNTAITATLTEPIAINHATLFVAIIVNIFLLRVC